LAEGKEVVKDLTAKPLHVIICHRMLASPSRDDVQEVRGAGFQVRLFQCSTILLGRIS